MPGHSEVEKARIRELNDQLRRGEGPGKIILTSGILARADVPEVIKRIESFDTFDEDCDPHQEHDFGVITIGDEMIFFKVDYYDRRMEFGSPDPSDVDVTCRVMTVMLASEY